MTNSDLAALVRSALAAKTQSKKASAPAPKDDATADAAAALRAIGWTERQIKEALASAAPKQQDNVTASVGEYNGRPTLTLKRGTGLPFTFGIAKARMVIEAYEQVKRFAESQD